MAATIKDVARLAGVSIATVSRAMNKNVAVSPQKRRKIEAAIKTLHYQPNVLAQHMTAQRLNHIAVLPSHAAKDIMVSPYVARMLVGLRKGFSDANMEILLAMEDSVEAEMQKCSALIDAGVVRGIILMGARVEDATIQMLCARGIPFVVLGHPLAGGGVDAVQINSVDTDSVSDVRAAVSHLIAQGHKRIALMHSPLGYTVNQERHDGYAAALRDAGIAYQEELVFNAGYTTEDALQASAQILSLENRPTAVMATDDMKAIAFLKKANEFGVRVPEDVSIVGHNNYEESRLVVPSLSTVDVPLEDLALTAAKLLLEIIEDPTRKAQRILLPTHFVERDSVKALLAGK